MGVFGGVGDSFYPAIAGLFYNDKDPYEPISILEILECHPGRVGQLQPKYFEYCNPTPNLLESFVGKISFQAAF